MKRLSIYLYLFCAVLPSIAIRIDQEYDAIIKAHNPYHAVQRIIRSHPAWVKSIMQCLTDENHTPSPYGMRVLITLPRGNPPHDAITRYYSFLSLFTEYCRRNHIDTKQAMHIDTDQVIYMELRAEIAKEGKAHPGCGFRFNALSGHPTLVENEKIAKIPDYRTWHVLDKVGDLVPKRYVIIKVIIEKPNASSNFYAIDLEFCCCK